MCTAANHQKNGRYSFSHCCCPAFNARSLKACAVAVFSEWRVSSRGLALKCAFKPGSHRTELCNWCVKKLSVCCACVCMCAVKWSHLSGTEWNWNKILQKGLRWTLHHVNRLLACRVWTRTGWGRPLVSWVRGTCVENGHLHYWKNCIIGNWLLMIENHQKQYLMLTTNILEDL